MSEKKHTKLLIFLAVLGVILSATAIITPILLTVEGEDTSPPYARFMGPEGGYSRVGGSILNPSESIPSIYKRVSLSYNNFAVEMRDDHLFPIQGEYGSTLMSVSFYYQSDTAISPTRVFSQNLRDSELKALAGLDRDGFYTMAVWRRNMPIQLRTGYSYWIDYTLTDWYGNTVSGTTYFRYYIPSTITANNTVKVSEEVTRLDLSFSQYSTINQVYAKFYVDNSHQFSKRMIRESETSSAFIYDINRSELLEEGKTYTVDISLYQSPGDCNVLVSTSIEDVLTIYGMGTDTTPDNDLTIPTETDVTIYGETTSANSGIGIYYIAYTLFICNILLFLYIKIKKRTRK